MAKKRDLKEIIEHKLKEMFESSLEPNEQWMKLLKIATGFVAVKNKLEETEYGGFFEGSDTGADGDGRAPKREKARAGFGEGEPMLTDVVEPERTH